MFADEMLGFPEIDEEYEDAFRRWREYYYRTERFDRAAMSGRTDEGVAVPANTHQYAAGSEHALRLRRELGLDGIQSEKSKMAKRQASRLSHDQLRTHLENRI